MSSYVKECFKDLEFISKIKSAEAKKVMLKYYSQNPKIYLALREIAINVIKGHIDLDNKKKIALRQHKKQICELASSRKKLCAKSRKKLVVQSGGWLWLIPIISNIIDLIN
jgi:hypothetical protein